MKRLLAVALAAGLLAACGGAGADPPAAAGTPNPDYTAGGVERRLSEGVRDNPSVVEAIRRYNLAVSALRDSLGDPAGRWIITVDGPAGRVASHEATWPIVLQADRVLWRGPDGRAHRQVLTPGYTVHIEDAP